MDERRNVIGWFEAKEGWAEPAEEPDWLIQSYRRLSGWSWLDDPIGEGSWLSDPIGGGSWLDDQKRRRFLIGWSNLRRLLIGWSNRRRLLIGWSYRRRLLIGWFYRRRLQIGWSYVRRLLIGWSYSIGGGSWLVNNTNEQLACPDIWGEGAVYEGISWGSVIVPYHGPYCILLRLAHVRGPLTYITPSGRLYILYICIYISIIHCVL